MNNTILEALTESLKLYEASVKRMQNAKPKFAAVYETELAAITEARAWLNTQKPKS